MDAKDGILHTCDGLYTRWRRKTPGVGISADFSSNQANFNAIAPPGDLW